VPRSLPNNAANAESMDALLWASVPSRSKTTSFFIGLLAYSSFAGHPICYNIIEAATLLETTMELPVKFPSETEVILEDVARFRALSPRDRIRAIQSLLNAGEHLMRISPKAAWAKQYAEEQKDLAQRNIREFIARHGY
jgi:hypothetical protein